MTGDPHLAGLARLPPGAEAPRLARALETPKGLAKWRGRLAHSIAPREAFCTAPARGARDPAALRRLGAPERCRLIVSDMDGEDADLALDEALCDALPEFTHGAFLSCLPGKLALFRSAWPHAQLIVHRP